MARPKEGIGPSAQQRIEEAYWALLESMPHEKITIGQLCTKALQALREQEVRLPHR